MIPSTLEPTAPQPSAAHSAARMPSVVPDRRAMNVVAGTDNNDHRRCELCGNALLFQIHSGAWPDQKYAPRHAPRFYSGPHAGFRLLECSSCGLVHIVPTIAQTAADQPVKAGALPYRARMAYGSGGILAAWRARRRINRLHCYVHRGTVVDVGSGSGLLAAVAARHGFTPIGIDVDAARTEAAQHRYPAVRFVQRALAATSRANLGIPNGADALFCGRALVATANITASLRRMNALLRQGGILDLRVPDFGHWRRPVAIAEWDAFWPERDRYLLSWPPLASALRDAGFVVVARQRGLSSDHRIIAQRDRSVAI